MKEKIKSYNFWTALAGAIVILINSIGKACGFIVESDIVYGIVMAFAGLLVVFGIVTMPKKEDCNEDDKNEDNEKDDWKVVFFYTTASVSMYWIPV